MSNGRDCGRALYHQIIADGGVVPYTEEMLYWLRDYLSCSIMGSTLGAKHWYKFILEQTSLEHRETVEKTLDDFSTENIKKNYPEFCL